MLNGKTSIAETNDQATPVLDQSVLARLRWELDDNDGVWRVFVLDFIAHMPPRIERSRLALTTGDLPGGLDAVLSLKTSSEMVGAQRLARLVWNLDQCLRQESTQADPGNTLPRLAAAHYKRIRDCARLTSAVLVNYVHPTPYGLPPGFVDSLT